MAGDVSRSTFQHTKHYSGVRMQQGRVQMDADWNEQVDISAYLARIARLDVIGPSGVPRQNAGFALNVQQGNLLITAGRIYVDGILCENDANVLIASPSTSSATPAQPDLPGVVRSGAAFGFEPLLVKLGGGPGFDLPVQPGLYAAYLDVWERDITAIDDSSIREIALGGPDTATRTKTIWQIKLHSLAGSKPPSSCPSDWESIFTASTGQLRAQAQPTAGSSDPCSVPAQAGYRSLENQLYRVEVHQGGTAGQASIKWSRDNASVIAAWNGQDPLNPANLFVSTLGKDQVLGFASGQWVELTDDTRELWHLPGTFVQVTNAQITANGPTLTIAAAAPVNIADYPLNPKIRRWDQTATASIALQGGVIPITEGSWVGLENGVQIWFASGGTYASGDYWLIPGRTATAISSATVQWPADSGGNPLLQPPRGTIHHYCGLALLSFDSSLNCTVLCDCRPVFSSLAAAPCIHVTDIRTLVPDGELTNDTALPVTALQDGLRLVCDAPVDPLSITPATCSLTLDVPFPGLDGGLSGVFPGSTIVTLAGAVGVSGSSIWWIPNQQTVSWLYAEMAKVAALTKNAGLLLLRATLKGNFIWAQGCPSITLDGDVLGGPQISASGNSYTALQLPSGDGRPGGDFTCWFWVPGYCDTNFPAGYLPFASVTSIAGPDASGDSVVVGFITPTSLRIIEQLPLPDVSVRKIYCSRVQLGPSTYAFAYVPTAAERVGNFSDFGAPIIDPLTGAAFPENIIKFVAGTNGLAVWAWRVRSIEVPSYPYGYYGYGVFEGIGAELI